MLSRRKLITGLISLAAAPAIVRVESLMPVKVIKILSNEEIVLKTLEKIRLNSVYGKFGSYVYYEDKILKSILLSYEDIYANPTTISR